MKRRTFAHLATQGLPPTILFGVLFLPTDRHVLTPRRDSTDKKIPRAARLWDFFEKDSSPLSPAVVFGAVELEEGELFGDGGFEARLFFAGEDGGTVFEGLLGALKGFFNGVGVDVRGLKGGVCYQQHGVMLHLQKTAADEQALRLLPRGAVGELPVGNGGNQIRVPRQNLHDTLRGGDGDVNDLRLQRRAQGRDDFEMHSHGVSGAGV